MTKQQDYERGICNLFLQLYNRKFNKNIKYIRHGDPNKSEPDCICSDGINIEITDSYYSEKYAEDRNRIFSCKLTNEEYAKRIQEFNDRGESLADLIPQFYSTLNERISDKIQKAPKYVFQGKLILLANGRLILPLDKDDIVGYLRSKPEFKTPETSEIWLLYVAEDNSSGFPDTIIRLDDSQEKDFGKRRILTGSIVTSCVIAALIPILITWYGGGAYLRAMWLWLIPVIIFITGLILLFHYAILKAILLHRKEDPAKIAWGKSKTIAMVLAVVFVFVGWFLGVQIRQFRCRLIGKSCEPIFAALDGYKKEHGSYPEKLKDITGIDTIINETGITVTEGKGSSVPELSEAQVTFYLEPGRYVSVVPIEHKLFMSITRFYVYIRDSESDEWKKDHIVWFLMPKE